MIKLIASDMDGTLLDENSQVPQETYELIRKLNDKGIHFAVSSGRRYDTLCEMFAPVKDEMDFVASNGAQVYVNGEMVDREVYSHASILRLEKVVSMFDCLHLVLFDRTSSFLLADYEIYEPEIDKDLPNARRVYGTPKPTVNILKASVYCDNPKEIMDMSYALGRELSDDFVFAPSGSKWIDVMQKGVSKATGIQMVMDAHNIKPEDTMAFGDAMNDYEIMRMVGHPRAMGNARYAIKQIAELTIGDHRDQAVQAAMRQVLESL